MNSNTTDNGRKECIVSPRRGVSLQWAASGLARSVRRTLSNQCQDILTTYSICMFWLIGSDLAWNSYAIRLYGKCKATAFIYTSFIKPLTLYKQNNYRNFSTYLKLRSSFYKHDVPLTSCNYNFIDYFIKYRLKDDCLPYRIADVAPNTANTHSF